MKDNPAERRRVAALADHYFAEQCARLGPIGGAPAQRSRKLESSLDKLSERGRAVRPPAMMKPAFARQRLGGHGGGGPTD